MGENGGRGGHPRYRHGRERIAGAFLLDRGDGYVRFGVEWDEATKRTMGGGRLRNTTSFLSSRDRDTGGCGGDGTFGTSSAVCR